MAQIYQPQLVLASGSPRRAEILRAVGWPFTAQPADVDETRRIREEAVEYVERLAREKASAVAHKLNEGLVLGADTMVVCDGKILGKPTDEADARRMLRALSGRWHDVLTGVALIKAGGAIYAVAHERTRVKFGALSEEEIAWYAATGEPQDKAGAYAVQGRAALFIEGLEGDYWNVMGLPVNLLYRLLAV
jgi:septum formation protein